MTVVAVDVDQTVVNTAVEWWKWLEVETKKGLLYDEIKHEYDFSPFYQEELLSRGVRADDYWRGRDVYNNLSPLEGAVEALKAISEVAEIVFVSVVKGDHNKSKYYFLEKYFPFMSGYIATKEKQYVRADYLIDDRVDNLNRFLPYTKVRKCIMFNTPHRQFQLPQARFPSFDRWEDIRNYIIKKESR